jgi:hypothetical protein
MEISSKEFQGLFSIYLDLQINGNSKTEIAKRRVLDFICNANVSVEGCTFKGINLLRGLIEQEEKRWLKKV